MSRQLRVVLQEAERGFGRLVQTCLECEPGGPRVVGIFRHRLDAQQIVDANADAVIIEVTARRPLDLSWRNTSPLTYNIPVLVCAPSALLVPPTRDKIQVLVMPFTLDELLAALSKLVDPAIPLAHLPSM
jgi:hypothetical protein